VEHLDAVEHIAASVVTLPLERIVEWFVCATFFSKLDIGDVRQAVTRRSDAASLPDGDAGLVGYHQGDHGAAGISARCKPRPVHLVDRARFHAD
jgi:hypothetical protein